MWNIETIIEEMEKRVREGEPISPASWVETALRVNLLGEEIDNKIANYESEMIAIEAEYLKEDMTASKAKTLAKSQIDYNDYLKTKARFKRVNEWIMLAKKRAVIEQL